MPVYDCIGLSLTSINCRRATSILFAHEGQNSCGLYSSSPSDFLSGAKHLYLIDFDPTNLPNLKSTIETRYPDVKVCRGPLNFLRNERNSSNIHSFFQVTTQQADAADESAISGVCELALREEGRLDVFFANVTAFFRLALCLLMWARN